MFPELVHLQGAGHTAHIFNLHLTTIKQNLKHKSLFKLIELLMFKKEHGFHNGREQVRPGNAAAFSLSRSFSGWRSLSQEGGRKVFQFWKKFYSEVGKTLENKRQSRIIGRKKKKKEALKQRSTSHLS